MSLQRFYASPSSPFLFANNALGFRSGDRLDDLGPYARVERCPVDGLAHLRVTAYAQGLADTVFSIPAAFSLSGQTIRGFFSIDSGEIRFVPYDRERARLRTYRLYRYDLWADGEGGRSVNDIFRTDSLATFAAPPAAEPSWRPSYLALALALARAFGIRGGEEDRNSYAEDTIYLLDRRGDPLCELRREDASED